MVIKPEAVKEILCWVCGEKVEKPVRRWLGAMPICKRCAANHAETFTPMEVGK